MDPDVASLSVLLPCRCRPFGGGRDRSGRGLLPESQTDFDGSDSVNSRHDLPHHQGVTQDPDGREAPFMFVWTSIMQSIYLLQRVRYVLYVTLFSFSFPIT